VSSERGSPNNLTRWQPGTSGNPRGGAVNLVNLAVRVRRMSRDGAEMVSFLFSVMRGEPLSIPGRNGGRPQRANVDQRLRAAELLLDRGYGRSREIIELAGETSTAETRKALLMRLSEVERATLHEILQKALAPGDTVEDSPATELHETAPTPDPGAEAAPAPNQAPFKTTRRSGEQPPWAEGHGRQSPYGGSVGPF
jgi:hypothetical protein